MILYNYDLDENCYRVRLLAACLRLTLAIEPVDMFPGREHLSPPLLALNPLGRLPILKDGDLVLRDTGAILLHLSAAAGDALIPSGADRSAMFDWLFFALGDLSVAAKARTVAMTDAPGDLDALCRAARAGLRIMDDHMTRQGLLGLDGFAGPALSLADLALFPTFALSRDYNVDHDEFPALRLWARRVRKLPGFITMPGIPDYH